VPERLERGVGKYPEKLWVRIPNYFCLSAYALGCNAYLTKPVAYDQFVEVIQKLGWLLTEIEIPKGAS